MAFLPSPVPSERQLWAHTMALWSSAQCGAGKAASGDTTLSRGGMDWSGGSHLPWAVVGSVTWMNGACRGGGPPQGRAEELGA